MISSIKFFLSTCSIFLLSSTSVHALTILGDFSYDAFTLTTTFGNQPVAAGTATFSFDTDTNTGTVIGFSGRTGNIAATGTIFEPAFSTFSPTTDLFDSFVVRYDDVDGGTIQIAFISDFDGLQNGGAVPFTISTSNFATQFITGSGTISSFNQAVAVPFEFSPLVGLSVAGGLLLGNKFLKSRKKN